MTRPRPRPVRGFYCRVCAAVRPHRVLRTHYPAPGVAVRYRRCRACPTVIRTEERPRTMPGRG